ncbi:ABC transporter ATP-binding protein [Staphylococcus petrasii]|uniref:Carnitine transport ATP-binding protein OpuCA n=1 Tax=Staphylococcus petrasii TaxID=1276936 RepID=A0A380G5I6_9STAP|nr:ABC transporter ATP-binding protein [Staphylococcus petrasii]PNZ28482.1 ABC transporter ATP-binding protein [Staphylococcus petrasii]TGE12313.1 ABC transporter ATP-binding protein [Staphylococcus petrasii]TGE17930.1 ABC transporter ATP-binding protein [Staphylococcus petrasii]SUM45241.1 ABC transporter ATP-binding protein [Staphylococcus petrasii]
MALELVNIKKSFDTKNVIKDVSLTIENGKFVSLLGESGCGKTTLLRLIAGLEKPDFGKIIHDENTYYSTEDKRFISPANRDLGMVFQDFALWPHMSVFQNVAYPLKVKKDTKNLKNRVMDALKEVHLEEHWDKAIHQLSGGQQQRVSLARAIISQSKLILMDEPLSALDATLREDMQILIKRLVKENDMTAIFVTHDQNEAMTMSDEIIVLSQGQIIQKGSPENLYYHPKSKKIATFIGKGTYIEGMIDNQYFKTMDDFKFEVPNSLKSGKCGALIRPENVCISENEKSLQATIENVQFTGERYQYLARINNTKVTFYDIKSYAKDTQVNLEFNIPENYFIYSNSEENKDETLY